MSACNFTLVDSDSFVDLLRNKFSIFVIVNFSPMVITLDLVIISVESLVN